VDWERLGAEVLTLGRKLKSLILYKTKATKILTDEGERERVVERGVCTNEPFFELLWWDGNLRTFHGVWNG
jgi:hypothetical protein